MMRALIRWNTEDFTEENIKNLDFETLVKCDNYYVLKLNDKREGDFAVIHKNANVHIFRSSDFRQVGSYIIKTLEKKPQYDGSWTRVDHRGLTKPANLTKTVQWLNGEIVEDELKGRHVIFFVGEE